MSAGRAILLMTLVIPGFIVMGSSLYAFDEDINALNRSEAYVERLSRDGASTRQIDFAIHRSLSNRINLLSDGTWGFIGAAIAAIGIHGISTIKDDDYRDYKDRKRS